MYGHYNHHYNPNARQSSRCGYIDPLVSQRSQFPQVPNYVRSYYYARPWSQGWGQELDWQQRPSSGRYGVGAPKAARDSSGSLVKQMLQSHPILMVSFSYCPHCTKLADKLNKERISYKKWDVDSHPSKSKIMDELSKISGIRTAPQMYVNGRFVGDGSKTTMMLANGKFHALIGRRKDTRMNVRHAPDLVASVLKAHPILMMSFSYCPHCKKLKQKLDEARIPYYKFEVDTLPNKPEVIDAFEKLSGIRTAPQMFIAGEFVGDGSTTTGLIETGELQQHILATFSC